MLVHLVAKWCRGKGLHRDLLSLSQRQRPLANMMQPTFLLPCRWDGWLAFPFGCVMPQIQSLVESCTSRDPKARPSFREVLKTLALCIWSLMNNKQLYPEGVLGAGLAPTSDSPVAAHPPEAVATDLPAQRLPGIPAQAGEQEQQGQPEQAGQQGRVQVCGSASNGNAGPSSHAPTMGAPNLLVCNHVYSRETIAASAMASTCMGTISMEVVPQLVMEALSICGGASSVCQSQCPMQDGHRTGPSTAEVEGSS